MVSSSSENVSELRKLCPSTSFWSTSVSSVLKDVQAVEDLPCCFTDDAQLVLVVDANEVLADLIGSLMVFQMDFSVRVLTAESIRWSDARP